MQDGEEISATNSGRNAALSRRKQPAAAIHQREMFAKKLFLRSSFTSSNKYDSLGNVIIDAVLWSLFYSIPRACVCVCVRVCVDGT